MYILVSMIYMGFSLFSAACVLFPVRLPCGDFLFSFSLLK